jgi:hypothetical protein
MGPDIVKRRPKQSAIAVLATHKPSAVIAQQPTCDPRLTIPVTTIEGKKEAPGPQDSADNAQGSKCVIVVKVMQQPVHHDDVGRSKLSCASFIEQSAMERAPRAKAPLCVLDVALVDVKTMKSMSFPPDPSRSIMAMPFRSK